jgi:KTSC domain
MTLDEADQTVDKSGRAEMRFILGGTTRDLSAQGAPLAVEWVGDPDGRVAISDALLICAPAFVENLPWRLVHVASDPPVKSTFDPEVKCSYWVRHHDVESDLVKSVAYDAPTLFLEMVLTNGAIYQYKGMTSDRYSSFRAADSLGKHFNKEIRGKYDCVCVRQAERSSKQHDSLKRSRRYEGSGNPGRD